MYGLQIYTCQLIWQCHDAERDEHDPAHIRLRKDRRGVMSRKGAKTRQQANEDRLSLDGSKGRRVVDIGTCPLLFEVRAAVLEAGEEQDLADDCQHGSVRSICQIACRRVVDSAHVYR